MFNGEPFQLGAAPVQLSNPVVDEPLIAEASIERALPGFEFLRRLPADREKLSLPKEPRLVLNQLWVEVVDPNWHQVFLKGQERKDLFWNSLKMTLHQSSRDAGSTTINFDRQNMTVSEQIFQQKNHSTLFCVNLDCELPTKAGIDLELDQIPIDVQINFLCRYKVNDAPWMTPMLTCTKTHELQEEMEEFVLEQCTIRFSDPEKISFVELLDQGKTVIKLSQIALQASPFSLDHLNTCGLTLRIKQQVFPDRPMPSYGITRLPQDKKKNLLHIQTKKELFFHD